MTVMPMTLLIVVFALAVAAALAVAVRQVVGAVSRREMRAFLEAITPRVAYSAQTTPPAPEYGAAAAWAVTPSAPGKALLTPAGVAAIDPERAPVDLFFIHPTTFFGTIRWNAPIDDERANEGVDELVVPSQASVFNGCCRIYAPRYRQATLYSFVSPNRDGRSALELAYGDVVRAFQHYLDHHNHGRPFVLASHSQGTCHAIRLLEEVIVPSPLLRRMVAAYLIGYWVPEAKLATTLAPLRPAASPTDTGCIVAFDTFGEGGGPDHARDLCEHFYPVPGGGGEWRRRAGTRPVCVNPLLGRGGTEPAPAALNLGAVWPLVSGIERRMDLFTGEQPLGLATAALSAPLLHHVSARCGQDGFLYVSRPRASAFRLAVMPGRNYHNYDYGLFYMNLRADVERRVKAFTAATLGTHAGSTGAGGSPDTA